MTDTLKKLIELQEMDAELFLMNRQIAEIPKALRREQSAYEKACQELGKEKQTRQALDEQHKKTTLDLETAAEHVKQLKNKQGHIRKNVEYQALTQEIKTAEDADKRHRAALEQQIESRKSMSERIVEREKGVEAVKREILHKAEQAKKAVKEIQERVARQKLLRRDFAKQVNAEALGLYTKLFKTRAPNVIVPVKRGVCSGCHIKLPAQVIADIIKADRLVICDTCARILYIEPGSTDAAAE